MKKGIMATAVLLGCCILLGSCSQAPSSTAKAPQNSFSDAEISQASSQAAEQSDFAIVKAFSSPFKNINEPEEFSKMGATSYTLDLVQRMFRLHFTPQENQQANASVYKIENHPSYPKQFFSESELLEKLKQGQLDLALIQKTKDDTSFDPELEYTLVGREGLALFTSIKNPVTNISTEQLNNILVSRSCTNWSALGGADGKITLLWNHSYKHGADLLSQLVLKNTPLPDLAIDPADEKKIWPGGEQQVERGWAAHYPGNDYVLDYAPFLAACLTCSIEPGDGIEDGAKPITLNSQRASIENIADGSYPYCMQTYIVTKKGEAPTLLAGEISNFLLNETAQCTAEKMAAGIGLLTKAPQLYNVL